VGLRCRFGRKGYAVNDDGDYEDKKKGVIEGECEDDDDHAQVVAVACW
jgi:hypothetical protein